MPTPTEAQSASEADQLAQQSGSPNDVPYADTTLPNTFFDDIDWALPTSGNWIGLNYSAGRRVPPHYILTPEDLEKDALTPFDEQAKQHDKTISEAEKQFQKDLHDPNVNSFQREYNYYAAVVAADKKFIEDAKQVEPEEDEEYIHNFVVKHYGKELTSQTIKEMNKRGLELAFGLQSAEDYQKYLDDELEDMDWDYYNEGEDQYDQSQIDLVNTFRRHSGLPPKKPVYTGPPPSPTDPQKVTDNDPFGMLSVGNAPPFLNPADIDPYASYHATTPSTPNAAPPASPAAPAPAQPVDIWGNIPGTILGGAGVGNPGVPAAPDKPIADPFGILSPGNAPPAPNPADQNPYGSHQTPSAPPVGPAPSASPAPPQGNQPVDIWGGIPDLTSFDVGTNPSAAPAPAGNPFSADFGGPGGFEPNTPGNSDAVSPVDNSFSADFGGPGGYDGSGFYGAGTSGGTSGGSGGGQAQSAAEAGMDAAQGGPADSGAGGQAGDAADGSGEVDMGEFAEPVILDLNDDGFDIVPLGQANVTFDILGDGQQQLMAWVGPDDALLVYDRDGDHLITHREEIAFIDYMDNAETDLEGLAWFDQIEQGGNEDGVLNALDAAWKRFGVWRDADQDGETDPGELRLTGEGGLTAVNLESDRRVQWAGQDYRIFGRGTYEMMDDDGRVRPGDLYDAALRYKRQPGQKTRARFKLNRRPYP